MWIATRKYGHSVRNLALRKKSVAGKCLRAQSKMSSSKANSVYPLKLVYSVVRCILQTCSRRNQHIFTAARRFGRLTEAHITSFRQVRCNPFDSIFFTRVVAFNDINLHFVACTWGLFCLSISQHFVQFIISKSNKSCFLRCWLVFFLNSSSQILPL